MGSGEGSTPKTPKASVAQEQSASVNTPTAVPDWSSIQAYYNSGGNSPIPPVFYPPVAAAHQGHPYMWPPQHVIAPYGTPPPPYVAMYHHGGLYSHPQIPPGTHPYSTYAMPSSNGTGQTSVLESGGIDLDGKTNDNGKGLDASADGDASQSGESGAEGSSEGSDAQSPNVTDQSLGSRPGEAQNGIVVGNTPGVATKTTVALTPLPHATALVPISPGAIAGPATTLNIGMDYWSGTTSSSVTPSRSKLPVKPALAGTLSSSRDVIPSDLWLQDEREIKRQKRKQSNRESARRSRLRKQAECEELAQRVGILKEENCTLADELQRVRKECDRLTSENASLTERVHQLRGDNVAEVDESGVTHKPGSNSPEASEKTQ